MVRIAVRQRIRVRSRQWLIWKILRLEQMVDRINSKPGYTFSEPKPHYLIHLLGDRRIPKVQIRLLFRKLVQIELTAPWVEGPCRAVENRLL